LGVSFEKLLSEVDWKRYRQLLLDIPSGGNSMKAFEHELICKNGGRDLYKTLIVSRTMPDGQAAVLLRLQCLSDMLREKENLDILRSLYDTMAEQANETFFMFDGNGRILDVNRIACQRLGFTRDELLTMNIADLDPDCRPDTVKADWARISPGESIAVRSRHLRRDGSILPVDVRVGCVTILGERYYIGLATDMSVFENAEKRYRTIVEAAPDPIFIQTDEKFAYLNPAACTFFGISTPEELIGTPVADRFDPTYRDIINSRIHRLNNDKLPVEDFCEYRFIANNGEVWGETKGVPFEYEGENGALVFLRDVTKKKLAEEALLASERKYGKLFSDAAVPILIERLPEHQIVDVNDAWVQLFGYKKDAVLGKSALELGIASEYISDEEIRVLVRESNTIRNYESKHYTKSGEELIVLSNISISEHNGIQYALITNQDITERKRAEERLFASNELFRKSFENSALPTCLNDIKGRLLAANRMMCRVFGYEKEELEGKLVSEISHPDDFPISHEAIVKLIRGQAETVTFEKRYIRKNGEVFYAIETSAVIRDRENEPVHLVTQIQDVTEIRRLMNELRASEQFARTIMDNLPIGISVNSYEPPLQFEYMNDKFIEFYRTSREALGGGDAFFEVVYEDPVFREKIKKRVLDDMKSGDPARMRWENIPIARQGHETRYISAYNTLVPDRDLHISIVTDETERVRAMEEIKVNAARLQAIHEFDLAILRGFESLFNVGENALDSIFSLLKPDMAGVAILGLNDAVMYVVKSFRGQKTSEKFETDVSESELALLSELSDPISVNAGGGKPPAVITQIFKCPGLCNCWNIPVFTAGRLRGIINIGYTPPGRLSKEQIETVQEMATQVALAIEQTRLLQVTEQYATGLEQMIRDRTSELEEANKELESFTFSVSHDLRAPLRSMHGFVRILQEDYGHILDDEGRRICTIIAGSAQNMGQLIDDLLTLSRIGRSALAMSPVDMRALAERVFIELTNEQQRAVIAFSVGELPEAYGDLHLIHQVWVNLIDNAIKFTSKRAKPRIRISGETNGNETVYAVEDNGAGFSMAYKDKLFGVFQRLHSQKDFSGTGVGLAIIARIVRRHGGRAWANGEENAGATFYFSLKREDTYNGV
jgi:PAS domain S-box-containing protein